MADVKSSITTILSRRRRSAFERARLDWEKARKDATFAALDDKVRSLSVQVAYNAASGREDENSALLKELTSKRDEWLKAHKLSITPAFTCSECEDTGRRANGEVCACVKRLFNELVKNKSRGALPPFRFKDNAVSSMNCAQQKTLDKAYSLYKKFADEFPDTPVKCLILSGNVGSGKTCLMAAVGNALADRGYTVCFTTAFRFNKQLLEYHTSDLRVKAHILDEFLDADMLMIDDLGTEQIYKNVTLEYMYDIFDTRLSEGKSVMITTNLDNSELNDRYGERIYSRLFNKRYSSYKRIIGSDLRMIKR